MSVLEFNDAEVSAIFAALQKGLDDLTPATTEIAELWLTTTQNRFSQGVAPDGPPWAAKSPATIARYESHGYSGLTRSLIGTGENLWRGLHSEATNDSVSLGSSRIQAAVMQFGAEKGSLGGGAPWGDIPARPFLGVSEDDNSMIREVLTEYLQGLPT